MACTVDPDAAHEQDLASGRQRPVCLRNAARVWCRGFMFVIYAIHSSFCLADFLSCLILLSPCIAVFSLGVVEPNRRSFLCLPPARPTPIPTTLPFSLPLSTLHTWLPQKVWV